MEGGNPLMLFEKGFDEALEEIKFLYSTYALESNDNLTNDAIELKEKIITFVEEIKELPPPNEHPVDEMCRIGSNFAKKHNLTKDDFNKALEEVRKLPPDEQLMVDYYNEKMTAKEYVDRMLNQEYINRMLKK